MTSDVQDLATWGALHLEEHVIGRLTAVLNRHKQRLGSWVRLAESIDAANDQRSDRRIDRRTLEKICSEASESVQLKLGQLLALDNWFSISNEGSLLTRDQSLIDSLAESYSVNFLVAARSLPEMHHDAIARYDLRAITRLLRTPLNKLRVGIWDIAGPENWRASDARIMNAANIAIGSPVSNYASEIVMSRMVGVAAHAAPGIDALPFYIVGADRDGNLNSSFIRTRSAATMHNPAAGISIEPNRRALVVNDKWYVSSELEDYALLLAQRNPDNGQVQLVLCGLTGQGTYQLARLLQAGLPAKTMPPLRAGEKNPPILTAVFRLSLAPAGVGQSPWEKTVIGVAAAEDPVFIRHLDGGWQFLE